MPNSGHTSCRTTCFRISVSVDPQYPAFPPGVDGQLDLGVGADDCTDDTTPCLDIVLIP